MGAALTLFVSVLNRGDKLELKLLPVGNYLPNCAVLQGISRFPVILESRALLIPTLVNTIYSFTPPAVIPPARFFCMEMKRMITGVAVRTDAAMIRSHMAFFEVKSAFSPIGRV